METIAVLALTAGIAVLATLVALVVARFEARDDARRVV